MHENDSICGQGLITYAQVMWVEIAGLRMGAMIGLGLV